MFSRVAMCPILKVRLCTLALALASAGAYLSPWTLAAGATDSADCASGYCSLLQWVSFSIATNGDSFVPTPLNPLYVSHGNPILEGACTMILDGAVSEGHVPVAPCL